jgi:hypothetical protein
MSNSVIIEKNNIEKYMQHSIQFADPTFNDYKPVSYTNISPPLKKGKVYYIFNDEEHKMYTDEMKYLGKHYLNHFNLLFQKSDNTQFEYPERYFSMEDAKWLSLYELTTLSSLKRSLSTISPSIKKGISLFRYNSNNNIEESSIPDNERHEVNPLHKRTEVNPLQNLPEDKLQNLPEDNNKGGKRSKKSRKSKKAKKARKSKKSRKARKSKKRL